MKKLLLCFLMSGFYTESFASSFAPKTKNILKYSAIVFTADTICHSIQYGEFRRRHYGDYIFQFLHKKSIQKKRALLFTIGANHAAIILQFKLLLRN